MERKKVIFLVGEKSSVYFHLRDILISLYDILETAEADEGFRLTKTILPDLVIFINNLAGTDFTGLCKAFRSDSTTVCIPLMLVFWEGSEEIIIKGFESGADDCIVWPFNANIFKARVKSLLDNRKQLLDNKQLWNSLFLSKTDINSTELEFLEQIHGILEENLANPLFKVERLCDVTYMSRSSMYRKIRSLTGGSPQLYIRSYRLRRAAQLLEQNFGNVTEVCFRVGFTSTAYFTKCFKKKFQLCPKIFARAKGRVS